MIVSPSQQLQHDGDQLRLRTEHAKQREDLATMIAHDLRNPLNAILMRLQVVLEAANADVATMPIGVLTEMQRNGKRMARMINELLDSVRIESGQLKIERRLVDPVHAVLSLFVEIAPTLGAHPLETRLRGIPPQIFVDPDRFQQILVNLLENAAKFSPESEPIEVLIEPGNGGVTVSVRDRGVGIAPEDQPRLFDRFYRSTQAPTQPGFGLGLYICKGFVEAHGGRIWVESRPPEGSIFHVWLPAA